jgi:hypothetical protein
MATFSGTPAFSHAFFQFYEMFAHNIDSFLIGPSPAKIERFMDLS